MVGIQFSIGSVCSVSAHIYPTKVKFCTIFNDNSCIRKQKGLATKKKKRHDLFSKELCHCAEGLVAAQCKRDRFVFTRVHNIFRRNTVIE